MDPVFPILVIVLIGMVALLAWVNRGRTNNQVDDDNPDFHILHSEYQSGVGGGESRTWKIPKDPQAYAKLYIPKDKKK